MFCNNKVFDMPKKMLNIPSKYKAKIDKTRRKKKYKNLPL